ncbi:MAG: BTAD domain-containing putative transcriptional regulator, partial [Gaiellaceae bacterium]
MEFRILGPLEVDGAAGPIDLSGGKQRALLAILLLHANEVVDSARLIEALWSDGAPADAAKALQIHVSRLRRALAPEDVVQTRPGGYIVAADADSLDLPRFEQLVVRGRTRLAASDAAAAREALVEALALWRGPPLAEFAAEPFARAEIARLDELHAGALEARVEADLALGAHAALVPELEALVARYPLRERLREQLMLALYRAGRQAEALQAYRDARTTLVEELGIEPGRQLQELEQAILRQDPSLDPATLQARAGRRAAGAFVGRDREVEELSTALDDAAAGRGRLFLVSGESGIGKTRLADEVASRAKEAGLRLLWGRSAKAEGAPPYWLWSQALRPLQ